jgi:hypothetical protein
MLLAASAVIAWLVIPSHREHAAPAHH